MGWRKLIIGSIAVLALAGSYWLQLSAVAMQCLTLIAVIGIGSQAAVDAILAWLTGKSTSALGKSLCAPSQPPPSA